MGNEETSIDQERIAAIIAEGGDTRSVVHKIAAHLFLDCHTYPSAQKIRSLIGRGSMTTIGEALNDFWVALKSDLNSRLTIPGVPPDIERKLAEFGATLWTQAAQTARADFADDRQQLEALVQENLDRWQDALANLEAHKAAHATAIAQLRSELTATEAARAELSDQLISAKATNQHLNRQIEQLSATIADLNLRIEQNFAEFVAEQGRQRAQIRDIEERAKADITHHLLEVDKARGELKTAKTRFDKDLGQLNERLQEAVTARSVCEHDLANARSELASTKERAESLVQQVATLSAANDALQRQLASQQQESAQREQSLSATLASLTDALATLQSRVGTLGDEVSGISTRIDQRQVDHRE